MIRAADLVALRSSFATCSGPGLPKTLAADFARVLGVSDLAISFIGTSDHVLLRSSSGDARSMHEWEFSLGTGPGFDAAVTGTATSAGTAASPNNPWPRLSAKARAIGYEAIAGVPWRVQGTTFATLTLQDRHGSITSETLADAERVGDELASLMVSSLGQSRFLDLPADHDTFHQATGMVMKQMGIEAGSAVDVLRAHAWSHDRLLMEVATEVVGRALTFRLEIPPHQLDDEVPVVPDVRGLFH
ncbi:MAG: ANTAR domain-containing protein [Acidimicrobiia bacterium]